MKKPVSLQPLGRAVISWPRYQKVEGSIPGTANSCFKITHCSSITVSVVVHSIRGLRLKQKKFKLVVLVEGERQAQHKNKIYHGIGRRQ